MLRNLEAVAANYRQAGIRLFVLAHFVRDSTGLRGVQEALGIPLRARPQRTIRVKESAYSPPVSTYSAAGGLPQDPGRAA